MINHQRCKFVKSDRQEIIISFGGQGNLGGIFKSISLAWGKGVKPKSRVTPLKHIYPKIAMELNISFNNTIISTF